MKLTPYRTLYTKITQNGSKTRHKIRKNFDGKFWVVAVEEKKNKESFLINLSLRYLLNIRDKCQV